MSTNIMIISTINKTYKLLFIFTLYYITCVIICHPPKKHMQGKNTSRNLKRRRKTSANDPIPIPTVMPHPPSPPGRCSKAQGTRRPRRLRDPRLTARAPGPKAFGSFVLDVLGLRSQRNMMGYPLVNQHNYGGKPQFLIGKSAIPMGHFQ